MQPDHTTDPGQLTDPVIDRLAATDISDVANALEFRLNVSERVVITRILREPSHPESRPGPDSGMVPLISLRTETARQLLKDTILNGSTIMHALIDVMMADWWPSCSVGADFDIMAGE